MPDASKDGMLSRKALAGRPERVLLLASIHKDRDPFGEGLGEATAEFYFTSFPRLSGDRGAIVQSEFGSHIICETKDKEAVVDEDGVEGLTVQLCPASPATLRAEGAADTPVEFAPVLGKLRELLGPAKAITSIPTLVRATPFSPQNLATATRDRSCRCSARAAPVCPLPPLLLSVCLPGTSVLCSPSG